MSPSMSNNRSRSCLQKLRADDGGFSMLEMMVAMLVLTIALLGVAGAIGYALAATNRGRGVSNSKMLVVSILEQMETLRDSRALTFQEISNTRVTNSPFTGFPYNASDWRPVSTVPGSDGVFGTADDLWGASGTTDDLTLARPGVSRQILITTFPTNPFLKRIQVTLRYSTGDGKMKDLVGVSYLNDDSHGTYIP